MVNKASCIYVMYNESVKLLLVFSLSL